MTATQQNFPGPDDINGVSLLTKKGTRRSRFSDVDRLKIIGVTQKEAAEFADLFAPSRPLYVRTRGKSEDPRDWYTPYGRLTMSLVIRHLTGGRIPNVVPVWVAPKCWEVSQWVGIDVDLRGDRDDFKRRCQQVETALWRLGVFEKAWLVTPTPSGGRHYRFFLKRKALLPDIARTLELVGITECSGRFEIFPKSNQGMRLPCGHGDPKHPRELLEELKTGARPRINWHKCRSRAESYATKMLRAGPESGHATAVRAPPRDRAAKARAPLSTKAALTVGRRPRVEVAKGDRNHELYQQLLVGPATPVKMQQLLDCGIMQPGTRVQATKRLAWHMIRARGLSVDEASSFLTEWAYRRGAETSKDVRIDVAKGTKKVADQTRSIVEYCAQLEKVTEGPGRTSTRISADEVDAAIEALRPHFARNLLTYVRFALRFLNYAKTHGIATPDGWESIVAAGGVMRRWPGFSGNKYAQVRRALEGCGIIQMTRQKWQPANGKGRPRTYLIQIPCELAANATLSLDDALLYARRQLAPPQSALTACISSHLPNDRYKRFEKPNPKEERVSQEEARLVQITNVFEGRESIGGGLVATTECKDRFKETTGIAEGAGELPQNQAAGSPAGSTPRMSRSHHGANRVGLAVLGEVCGSVAGAPQGELALGSRSPTSPAWVPRPGFGIPKRFRLPAWSSARMANQLNTRPP